MLQELLAELEREVALSKQEMSELKKNVASTKKSIAATSELHSPQKSVSSAAAASSEPHFQATYDLTMSHVIKQSPAYQFSKSQRFKDPKRDETSLSAAAPIPDILTAAADISSKLPHQKNPANVVFSQSARFPELKQDDFRDAFYDVNYAPIVRKAQAAVINPPKQRAKFSDNASTYSQGSVSSDLETQASMSQFMGPGAYDIKYDAVEPRKGCPIPKSKRFLDQKSELTIELNPNYDAIKKKAPGVRMRNAVPRNEKLQARDEQDEFIRLEAAMHERLRPVDAYKCVKPNSGAAVIRKRVYDVTAAPKNSRERIAAVFRFLDQLREIGGRGPAEYAIPEPEAAPTMVVYRKSSYSPIRKDPKEDIPGPDYYYCKDDMIREKKPVWTFAKEAKEKPMTVEDIDGRDYNVNIDAIRGNPTTAIILPEHLPKFIGEEGMLELKRGPGAYELNYEQTEKRADFGVVKMAPLNENNAREKNMPHLEAFERFDNDLIFPTVDAIKPNNQRGFKYHEPADVKPEHVPDKELFPEQWAFYDYDLNEIRENMKKGGDFSSKMNKDIFAEHEEFMRIMKDHYAAQNKVPHLGEYKVSYKQLDRHMPGVDLDKMQEKDIDPIVKPEGDVDGDNLILEDPSRPRKRLPDFNFKKMLGRPEEDRDNDPYEDVLEINVNLEPTKPKVPVLVNMKLQSERDDVFAAKQYADEEIDLKLDYKQIDPKIKGYVEIKKVSTREEDPNYNPKVNEEEIVLDIKPDVIKPKKSAGVNMAKGARRFPPPLPKPSSKK